MANIDSNKLAALQKAMKEIDKTHGAGTVMMMGDGSKHVVEHISSGCLSLDKALGIGGYPKGRIIELYGPESSGKTTVALHAIASCQAEGGVAAFIDAEHALDPVYAKAIGVDIENMIISQPDYGEQAIDVAEKLILTGAVDILVIDSVAALIPKAELEGDMESSQVGVQTRLMSKAMRKLTGAINQSKCIVIFINQIREKVGVMYGNPETTTGGRALKFFSSVRIEVRKIDSIKEGTNVVGNKVKAKIVKNKVAPPMISFTALVFRAIRRFFRLQLTRVLLIRVDRGLHMAILDGMVWLKLKKPLRPMKHSVQQSSPQLIRLMIPKLIPSILMTTILIFKSNYYTPRNARGSVHKINLL